MLKNWQNILILYIIKQKFRLNTYFLPIVFLILIEEMHKKNLKL